MAELEDCAPEAVPLSIKLGVAVCDCAEAGLDLEDIIETATSAFNAWFGRKLESND